MPGLARWTMKEVLNIIKYKSKRKGTVTDSSYKQWYKKDRKGLMYTTKPGL